MAHRVHMHGLGGMLAAVRMTNKQAADAVGLDRSMITYICKGGRPSQHAARALAEMVSSRDESLRVDAYVWMLSYGFAPPPFHAASREAIVRAIEALQEAGAC